MILGKKSRLKYTLKIESITAKEYDEVELLGITIDKALNFKRYVENLYRTAQALCSKTNQKLMDIR